MKKSKLAYCSKYFEANYYNTKKTWKGIKFLIFLKITVSSVPTLYSLANGDPYDIVNILNRSFLFLVETNTEKYKNILRMNVAVQYFCKEEIPNVI